LFHYIILVMEAVRTSETSIYFNNTTLRSIPEGFSVCFFHNILTTVSQLHILYSYTNIIRQIKSRRLKWAGHVARMGEERNVYRVLVGKTEGKRPLGRPRRGCKNGIRMDLRGIGCRGVEWIQLAQDRDRWRAVLNTVMNLRVLAPQSQSVSQSQLHRFFNIK
jgi:hypothetical protein